MRKLDPGLAIARRTFGEDARPAADTSVAISRVTEPVPELDAIDLIARVSFTEGGFSVEEELTRPWSRIWLARTSAAPERCEEQRIAGFLIAWHVADELHILNVATAPPLRRRGIATALMIEAMRYAASNRVRIILLEVRRSNRPAIQLYRRLGFTAMGIRPGYYSDDGEDAVEMVLGLDPDTGSVLPGRDEVRLGEADL